MKKDEEIYTAEELKFFKKIESGNYKPLSKKEFEKQKLIFKKAAENTLKKMQTKPPLQT